MASALRAVRLLDATTLRSIYHAIRDSPDRYRAPDHPDPDLLDVVEEPFDAAADAADGLATLERRLRERGDRRAVFLTIYVRMTESVLDGIERGRFADPGWMRAYLRTFADYYRRAFLAFERGHLADVPDPWRIAFGVAIREDALVIQDAYLGVNAHINYDLALALADVGLDPDRQRKYADHRAIDVILGRLIDAQQAALAERYAGGVDEIDAMAGRLDERLTLRSMTAGREWAWRVAVVLTDAAVSPIPAYARWLLCTAATGGAVFVLGPGLDPALRRRLRAVEQGEFDLDATLSLVRERLDAI